MAIDPATLAKQQRVAKQTNRVPLEIVGMTEVTCQRCGKRTRDRTGMHADCRRVGDLPLAKMSTEALVHTVKRIRAELERRRDEAAKALESA